MNLYNGIQDNWVERQTLNGVNVQIPVQQAMTTGSSDTATDAQAVAQYFTNPTQKRIVVFGHTHVARINTAVNYKNQRCVYANTGTWIDHNTLSSLAMTFVVITPQKSTASAPTFVNLYQYSSSGAISKVAGQAIMKLK